MTANEMRERMAFEHSLKVDDEVCLRWTWGGGYYQSKAMIIKLNKHSLKAAIQHSIHHWKAGHVITVPRFTLNAIERWSTNNGAFEQ